MMVIMLLIYWPKKMKTIKKDIVIIGSGTAGLAAYRAALPYTDSIALIESGPYGTTCARVGCMPSKLLIAAAEHLHETQQAKIFGIEVESAVVNEHAVMNRVRSERDRFVGFVEDSIDSIPDHHKFRGHATYLDEHRVMVESTTGQGVVIECRASIIATGSRPTYPKFFEQAQDRLVVNDDVFNWTKLPQSVAVFGPGVIGLELGQALSRLGVKVSLFGTRDNIGPLTDPVIKQQAHALFSNEFHLYQPDSQVTKIERSSEGVTIEFEDQGQKQQITSDYLLAATGRRPNTDQLGLEGLNLPSDNQNIPIAEPKTMQIGNSSIFIAGDASNQLPLLHEAADQGKIAGDNAGRLITQKPEQPGLRRSSIGIVFSDPQIAMIGDNYQSLLEKYNASCIAIGEVSFSNQGRSRVIAKNQGHLRIYAAQGSGRFLGAEMLGPRAEHIAHLLAWAHQQRMTISKMLDMPFYHPVIEEGVRTALRDTHDKLNAELAINNPCDDCDVAA